MKKSTIRQAKYDKDNTIRYNLKLNKKTDADIIALIDETSKKLDKSIQATIKHLIRAKNEV